MDSQEIQMPKNLIQDQNHEKLRLVAMLKALGNPVRFQIIETLAERQSCITAEIVETTPLAQTTVI